MANHHVDKVYKIWDTPTYVVSLLVGCVFLLLTASIFPYGDGVVGRAAKGVYVTLIDKRVQWVVVLPCVLGLIFSFLLRFKNSDQAAGLRSLNLVPLIFVSLSSYIIAYSDAESSTWPISFFGGLFLAEVAAFSTKNRLKQMGWGSLAALVLAITTALLFCAIWHPDHDYIFGYSGVHRWSGPWPSPNTYGGLMGVGLILTFGLTRYFHEICASRPFLLSTRGELGRAVPILGFLLLGAFALVFGVGLIKSLSRGAWVSTTIGIGWFLVMAPRSGPIRLPFMMAGSSSGARKTGSWVGAALIAFCAVTFIWVGAAVLQDNLIIKRLSSLHDLTDASLGNRYIAWRGAMEMILAEPWIGYGYDQVRSVYEAFYCPPHIIGGGAIETNDVLYLGVSFGAPAMVGFIIYAAGSVVCGGGRESTSAVSMSGFTRGVSGDGPVFPNQYNLLHACKSAAVALLMGICFSSMMFEFGPGLLTWFLLALDIPLRAENA